MIYCYYFFHKVDQYFKRDYPKLGAWIEKNIPKVKSKTKVWNAFIKYSELGATRAITPGYWPEVYWKVMPGKNGGYTGESFPNRIFLSKSLCDEFEEKKNISKKFHNKIESSLLHEMVHWGDFKDGKDQPGEEGKKFEVEAYGADI